jgi:hypothetical protein
MDPITAAIVAALAAGVVSGTTKVGEQVISDAYNQLKDLLKKKFGAKSKVVTAVKDLEANPRSSARKEVLKEEVAVAKADKDQELLQLAQSLIKNIKALPGGTQIVQSAIGDQIVQIAGDGNVVTVKTTKNTR